MRPIGLLQPTDQRPVAPDTVQTLLISAGTPQNLDWFTSTGAAANAGLAGVQLVRITACTTAGVSMAAQVNLFTTGVSSLTSGTTIGSSGVTHTVPGQGSYQIASSSTGWSAAVLTSGYVTMEQWRK